MQVHNCAAPLERPSTFSHLTLQVEPILGVYPLTAATIFGLAAHADGNDISHNKSKAILLSDSCKPQLPSNRRLFLQPCGHATYLELHHRETFLSMQPYYSTQFQFEGAFFVSAVFSIPFVCFKSESLYVVLVLHQKNFEVPRGKICSRFCDCSVCRKSCHMKHWE